MHDQSDLAQRKRDLLLRIACTVTAPRQDDDIFAGRAIASLIAGEATDESNTQVQRTARWFDMPHPHGRDLQGEPDFAAINLIFAMYSLADSDKLYVDSRAAVERFFLTTNFQSAYHSENHHLLFRASRYLAAQMWPASRFEAWDTTGDSLMQIDGAWLKQFIRYRAGHGWAEFDSACYLLPDFESLLTLHEFASDPELHRLAQNALNLLLVDMAIDSIDGIPGGAQGRIYPEQVTNPESSPGYAIQQLYFGAQSEDFPKPVAFSVQLAATSFTPDPLVIKIANERAQPYVNFERKHLHNMDDVLPENPLNGSIRKMTAWTPSYTLGAIQQQDPYPEGISSFASGYAFHQQHDWSLTFASSPRAKIFSHHPGTTDQHTLWTGDHGCGCGKFFMAGSTVLALYQIPPSEPLQYIHALVPKNEFDEVIEIVGWIIVRSGGGYGALHLVNGYTWVADNAESSREIRTPVTDGREAVVCVAAQACDYATFAAFQSELLGSAVQFDRDKMSLSYRSSRLGDMRIAFGGSRSVNGVPVTFDYSAYHSPYVTAPWGALRVELRFGDDQRVLDFT
ncbi:MAG TPA: hypothetical protein VGK19_01265 [Capsulimonadaceae bacterium]|jgi:hypothetical protein